MLTVALSGGLTTGKSTVGRMFAELGCSLVEADLLGHQALVGKLLVAPLTIAMLTSNTVEASERRQAC